MNPPSFPFSEQNSDNNGGISNNNSTNPSQQAMNPPSPSHPHYPLRLPTSTPLHLPQTHLKLMEHVQAYNWDLALSRVNTHPSEASERGPHGRTALHIACDHDAPAPVVAALLSAYPVASLMVGTSDMNPLHITCSSPNASVHVVKVLLEGSPPGIESMRDVDGDTPLHAACRCGAPNKVLEVLLRANPSVVLQRDYEGLTPLLRLWVRYFVILGDSVIESVTGPDDLVGALGEAWEKTLLLLRAAHHRSLDVPEYITFRAVHAASAVDCPRAVLKIAIALYPEQLKERDEMGRTPLVIAATSPIYKVHDLSADGFSYEEFDYGSATGIKRGEEDCHFIQEEEEADDNATPCVIDVIIRNEPTLVNIPDSRGRLPLNISLADGKCWSQGIKSIFQVCPDVLNQQDEFTGLYPFMLAAVENTSSLNTVYQLLKQNPELVHPNHNHHHTHPPNTNKRSTCYENKDSNVKRSSDQCKKFKS